MGVANRPSHFSPLQTEGVIMKNSKTAFMKGQYHYLRGEFGRSIVDFSNALKSSMDAGKVHVPLGLAYFKNGNFPEAAVEFSCALDHDQTNDYLLYLRGMTFMNMGNLEEAVDDLNASISLNGQRGFAYVARSLAFRAMHWDAESENDLKSALALANVEVELFIREFCVTPALQRLALSLFDVDKVAWGKELWEIRSSSATH